jgi:hypothetical protein
MHAQMQEPFQYMTRLNPKIRRFTLQKGNEKQRTRHFLNRRRIKMCNHATEF